MKKDISAVLCAEVKLKKRKQGGVWFLTTIGYVHEKNLFE